MITPATASTGSGHQSGAVLYPSPLGRCTYTPCWMSWTSSRKHHEANDTTTPMRAATMRSLRYCLLRISVPGSGIGGLACPAGAGVLASLMGEIFFGHRPCRIIRNG